MTQRQIRLSAAGLLLLRGSAVIGGLFGAFFLVTALAGQQRVILVVLVIAMAMPLLLIGLTGSLRWGTPTMVGLALTNAMIFVDPAAYLALALVAVVGATLTLAPRVSVRRTRGRPLS